MPLWAHVEHDITADDIYDALETVGGSVSYTWKPDYKNPENTQTLIAKYYGHEIWSAKFTMKGDRKTYDVEPEVYMETFTMAMDNVLSNDR